MKTFYGIRMLQMCYNTNNKEASRCCKHPRPWPTSFRGAFGMDQYTQDSLPLRVDSDDSPPRPYARALRPKTRKATRQLQIAKTIAPPETKQCRVCKTVKASAEFPISSYSRDGLFTRCTECNRKAANEYYEKNKQKRRWFSSHLRSNYGMTVQEYDSMLEAQDGLCAVCRGTSGKEAFAVDHDHVTGKVRGLLCKGCNIALGGMKDSPVILRAAADYLERHGK